VKQVAVRLIHAALIVAFVLVGAAAVLAQPRLPALTDRVVDGANVLSAGTRAALTQLAETHERATSNQVVVATVPSLQGYAIADFGVQLGRAWKLGQGDRNNGVLLLIAPNERDVRIEVGYGLEGDLTDVLAFQIIQNEILPRFRANDIDGGALAGMRAILGAIEGTYKAKPASPWRDYDPQLIIFLMFVLIAVVVPLFSRYRRPQRRFGSRYSSWDRRSGYGGFPLGGGWGSSGGDRSSAGGSFGGGGGSFGGGGASGKW
jgi:uncharacterized protein